MSTKKGTIVMTYEDDTRNFINENLRQCRENCPNLVTVAASLLPFYHCFTKTGYMINEDGTQTLSYELGTAPSSAYTPSSVRTIAEVTTSVVNIYEQDVDDSSCIYSQYELQIEGFWEYLRQLPRHVSNYGGYVLREENFPIDSVIDTDDDLLDDDDAE
jgi:hypothetical protein